jgi:hypothetical protein
MTGIIIRLMGLPDPVGPSVASPAAAVAAVEEFLHPGSDSDFELELEPALAPGHAAASAHGQR